MNDEEMAKKLKSHDEKAFEKIIDKYTNYVAAIVFNIVGERLAKLDIEEITSDTFITLWRNSDKIREDSLKAYIVCIAKSRAKDRLRREEKGEVYNIDDFDEADGTAIDSDYEKQEICTALKQEVDKLEDPDKEIIIRYYYFYQKTSQIAELLNLNLETVKTKLKRSRQKLKNALIERGY